MAVGRKFDFETGRWIAGVVLLFVALPLSLPAWMEVRFSVALAAAFAGYPLGMMVIAGALFWGGGRDGFSPAFAARLIQWAGILLIFAALPIAYAAGLADMENSVDDRVMALLLSFPILVFVFGFVLLWGALADRYGAALVLALLIPFDLALIVTAYLHFSPPDPGPMDTTPYQPDVVIPAAPMMPAPQAPPAPVFLGPKTGPPGTVGCRHKRHKKHDCEAPPVAVVVIPVPSVQPPGPIKADPRYPPRNAAPPVTSPVRP
jgi:hypothetical protein